MQRMEELLPEFLTNCSSNCGCQKTDRSPRQRAKLYFNALSRLDGKPGGLGEFPLPLVERGEHLRPTFERDGNVEQIDRALAFRDGVFLTQLIRAPKGVRPMNLRMREQPVPQVLFDLPKCGCAFRLCHIPDCGCVPQDSQWACATNQQGCEGPGLQPCSKPRPLTPHSTMRREAREFQQSNGHRFRDPVRRRIRA